MDRQIVYPGAIPLETDQLTQNRATLVAIGAIASALFGQSTTANNLIVTPTAPASMRVQISPGELYSLDNLDDTAYSSLPADIGHQILKQGIALDPVVLACAAPTTAGQSIAYLIQATFSEVDTDLVTLPYYNSSNPSTAYSGPANSGASQPTLRQGQVVVSAKAGIAAATGSQTPPAADSGYVGLAVVTVAYGATSIAPGNIVVASGAPVVPVGGILAALKAITYATRAQAAAGTATNLIVSPDALAQSVQGGSFLYGAATGSATALALALAPAPAALATGMTVVVKAASTNTGAATLNLNALGAKPITFGGNPIAAGMLQANQLYAMIYDGANWQLQSPTANGIVAWQFGSTGYEVYSHGKIEQWGVATSGSDGTATVTFQIPFPNSCDAAIATNIAATPPSAWPGVGAFTKTTFKISSASSTTTSGGAGVSSQWRAWGH